MNILLLPILLLSGVAAVIGQIDYDYGRVLGLSIWFYEAQRTGVLVRNRVDWRRDTFLNDGADVDLDLSGGYFDAGDHVKFGFPLASTMTDIGWGLLDYKDGYEASGEYWNGVDCLGWGLDYMIKTHAAPNQIWVNVGDGDLDHTFWGRPEDYPAHIPRPASGINVTSPGSDLAGEYAAAFAVGSMVFRNVDPIYADLLAQHARDCYDFGMTYRGKYSDHVPGNYYDSWAYEDELLLSAAWMYRLTGERRYLEDAQSLWEENYFGWTPRGYGWGDRTAGAYVMLARVDGQNSPHYVAAAKAFCDFMRYDSTKTPKGLIWLQEWGSLRSIATVVFACLQAAEIGIDPAENRAMARSQIGYMLGDTGRSFVVGFGLDPPIRPHHRASSCPPNFEYCNPDTAANSPNPNPNVLYGALVGGPDVNDYYVDDRQDYIKNEVALDYNAGFQSALAGMVSLKQRRLL